MKKTLVTYLIVPGIMFAIFIAFYRGAVHNMEAREAHAKQVKAEKDAAEQKRKDEVDRKAQEDAAKRQKAQEEADRAKEAKKEADYQNVMNQLKREADDYSAQADKLAKEVADLDISISQTRSQKEKLNRETFDLAKEVELAKIARRNAEIEIQRMVEIAGKKVADTSIAIAPPPPLPTNDK